MLRDRICPYLQAFPTQIASRLRCRHRPVRIFLFTLGQMHCQIRYRKYLNLGLFASQTFATLHPETFVGGFSSTSASVALFKFKNHRSGNLVHPL